MSSSKKLFLLFLFGLQSIGYAQLQVNHNQSFCRIKIIFHPVVGTKPLLFDSITYNTPIGNIFSIKKFKYFVSHIALIDMEDRIKKEPDNYFLIDENDSANQIISLQVHTSIFTNLEFYIGVDSAKNVSGVQTDALDPATGMFWTWNSGYIMAKLEGKSPQSKAPFGNITYHIGGFREKDNTIRKISLPLDKWSTLKNQWSMATIDINVDIQKWFDGAHPIKIAEKSFCMSPGKMAMEIADNYANMFSIKSVKVQ